MESTPLPTERRAWSAGPAAVLLAVLLALALFGASLAHLITSDSDSTGASFVAVTVAAIIVALVVSMVRVQSPGNAQVLQFLGKYVGTNRRTGLSLVLPLLNTDVRSVRINNFETGTIKVNDANSNPINIGAIVVWQVEDTAKAVFAVDELREFIAAQSESALRHVATAHPYDGGTHALPSLSGSTELVSQELAKEVASRVEMAGVKIIEARIGTLAYAPEIAQAMLQRQQAAAVVDARETIVEGAVSMVESALSSLEEKDIVDLDPERRAAMVSNLLVVLCSDNNAQPIVNAGSLYT